MTRNFEKIYPLTLGVLAPMTYWVLFRDTIFSPNIVVVYQSVINVSAITIGFLITAQSILVALDSREIISRMKEYKMYGEMLRYFSFTINISLILCVLSGLILLTDTVNKSVSMQVATHQFLFYVWLFCLVTTIFSFVRIARIFGSILNAVMNSTS